MSTTFPDIRAVIHRKDRWIIDTRGTTTGGAAQTIVDTNLKDTGEYRRGNQWNGGKWIGRYAAASANDREREVGGNSGNWFDGATGTLYQGGQAYTNSTTTEAYEISSVPPSLIFQCLQQAMSEFVQPWLQTLTVDPDLDFDMEDADASAFSVNGSNAAVSKVTASGRVGKTGNQALKILLSGSSGFGQNNSAIVVTPGRVYFVAVGIIITTGGPFYLKPYDNTNAAYIDCVQPYTSNKAGTVLWTTFTAPSGCYDVRLRIMGTANLDDVNVQYIAGPWAAGDAEIELPDFITEADQVRRIMTTSYSEAVTYGSLNAHLAASRHFSESLRPGTEWRARANFGFVHPAVLELDEAGMGYMWPGEIFYETLRKADSLTTYAFTAAGESVSSDLPTELLAAATTRRIAQAVVDNVNAGDPQANATLNRLLGPMTPQGRLGGGELDILLSRYEKSLHVVERVRRTQNLYGANAF